METKNGQKRRPKGYDRKDIRRQRRIDEDDAGEDKWKAMDKWRSPPSPSCLPSPPILSIVMAVLFSIRPISFTVRSLHHPSVFVVRHFLVGETSRQGGTSRGETSLRQNVLETKRQRGKQRPDTVNV